MVCSLGFSVEYRTLNPQSVNAQRPRDLSSPRRGSPRAEIRTSEPQKVDLGF